MRAMKIPVTALHGAVRFSLSRDNSENDVDRVIEVLPGIVAKLREISPFGLQEAAPQASDCINA
jgi:cysteine desulfurase